MESDQFTLVPAPSGEDGAMNYENDANIPHLSFWRRYWNLKKNKKCFVCVVIPF